MINGFHDDSYNPEEELRGTDDYSLKITTIYCCGPNASKKLKVISEVIKKCFPFNSQIQSMLAPGIPSEKLTPTL